VAEGSRLGQVDFQRRTWWGQKKGWGVKSLLIFNVVLRITVQKRFNDDFYANF